MRKRQKIGKVIQQLKPMIDTLDKEKNPLL